MKIARGISYNDKTPVTEGIFLSIYLRYPDINIHYLGKSSQIIPIIIRKSGCDLSAGHRSCRHIFIPCDTAPRKEYTEFIRISKFQVYMIFGTVTGHSPFQRYSVPFHQFRTFRNIICFPAEIDYRFLNSLFNKVAYF